jgi:hypothetical protein
VHRTFSRDVERDIDDELLYDLEERAEAFVRQGMSAAAARRAALQQFGCVDEVRRRTRDVDTLGWFRPVVLGVRETLPRSSGRLWAASVVVLVVVVAFGVALMRTTDEHDLEIAGSVRPSGSEPWPSHACEVSSVGCPAR